MPSTLGLTAPGAIPAPEKLLPDDTLVLVTAPDFARARQIWEKLPQRQFWGDPAMKPFRDRFMSKWDEEFVSNRWRANPGVKFDDYTGLPQGQLTFALTQNGWQGHEDQPFGLLLLLDAKTKSKQLTGTSPTSANNGLMQAKCSGRKKSAAWILPSCSCPAMTCRGPCASSFRQRPRSRNWGAEKATPKAAPGNELVLGQAESLLILGNSTKVVESVVLRLTGGSAPALEDLAAYQANHFALFRDAPLYAWVNSRVFFEVWGRQPEQKDNPEAPNPFDLKPERLMGASGVLGLKTIALSLQHTGEGELVELFLGVPEANRRGLFNILAGEPKESSPPPFVPADAVRFQRWRIDGQKASGGLAENARRPLPAGGEHAQLPPRLGQYLRERKGPWFRHPETSLAISATT